MPPNNPLPFWGNSTTMNLNNMILQNIQSSSYFRNELIKKKTYHEVIDEIYYKVEHLEPWEKGSRKTAGQTGMCGGVRGVGAGGTVSSAYCLLYKLFTLKLTYKQVQGLINHSDSPYIRALGFLYIRYCQDPKDLWEWCEPFLEDDEELDLKAGGGCMTTIGEMLRGMLTKLEWYSTLFPRIPVPVQKQILEKLKERGRAPVRGAEPLEEVRRRNEQRVEREENRDEGYRRDVRDEGYRREEGNRRDGREESYSRREDGASYRRDDGASYRPRDDYRRDGPRDDYRRDGPRDESGDPDRYRRRSPGGRRSPSPKRRDRERRRSRDRPSREQRRSRSRERRRSRSWERVERKHDRDRQRARRD